MRKWFTILLTCFLTYLLVQAVFQHKLILSFVAWANEANIECKSQKGRLVVFKMYDGQNDTIFFANCLRDVELLFTKKYESLEKGF